jgi:Na+/proline symporter
MKSYLKGAGDTRWIAIGVSVMATQASAVTFLSLPGQAYESGMSFIQNYFGAPLALILICIFFLPIFRRLNVYTAYEYLGRRFDMKTRLLGAGLFLLQRGIAAGITLYAPAIVLSTVLGWSLETTILTSGLIIVIYTVVGGSDAVTLTQKYQLGVIMAGMVAALCILLTKLPAGLTLDNALTVAGGFNKLTTVDYSIDFNKRYTIWSGIFGGMFLALSYFGADQSQVQRYLHGASVRESRLGLMFNAVCKIPMQFLILLVGAVVFVFYQFERPPVFFNQVAWEREVARPGGSGLPALEQKFHEVHAEKAQLIQHWLEEKKIGDTPAAAAARAQALDAHARSEAIRAQAKAELARVNPDLATKDSDYVFITFIFNYLPHGFIGLLVTAFFAATMSSKAGELNALSSTTMVDVYRHVIKKDASDQHYVVASRVFTALWGLIAIAFALMVKMAENLIEFGNILGSIFYGVPLGLFIIAFFVKRVGGTAAFWSAVIVQLLVLAAYFFQSVTGVSYLWLNPLGCLTCVLLSILIQFTLGRHREHPEPETAP